MSAHNELKELHDDLLRVKPADVEHRESDCPICAMETVPSQSTAGGYMPETFTQEELDAAVAAANSPLQQRLAELEAQVQESEVGKAVAEAIADKDTEISKLQEQLDAAEAARTAAETKLSETEQYWADAIAEHEKAAAFAARRAERTAAAKEAGVFSDEYIEQNADRFAAMADEDFGARMEEWRLIASKNRGKTKPSGIPSTTALVASRSDEKPVGSALAYIGELHAARVDPRALGGA